MDEERAKHWLGNGATPTDRVARFLSERNLVKWERGNNPIKAKPGKKAQERLEERRAAEEAAKEPTKGAGGGEAAGDEAQAEPAAEA